MSTTGDEPVIRELAVDTGDEHIDLRSKPSRSSSIPLAVVLVAVAAAIAGLTYGFLLGRGDRPEVDQPATTDTTTTTTQPTTRTTTITLPETHVTFVRSSAGRDLGAGVTEYLDPNQFTTVVAAGDGTIWAGGASGVVSFNPQTEVLTRLSDADDPGPLNVRSIVEGPDGTLWLATDRGMSRWRDGEWTDESRFTNGDGNERWVTALEVGDDGEVWLATLAVGGGPEDSQIHHTRAPFIGDVPTVTLGDYVQALESEPGGSLWALTNRALWEFDGAWRQALEPGPRWFHAMAIDQAGNIWFASEHRLLLWDGTDVVEQFWGAPPESSDPLGPQTFITDLATAPEAGVWALALQAGPTTGSVTAQIVRVGDGPAESVPLPDRLQPQEPRDLSVAPDGAVWLAGGTGLLRYDGEWTEYRMPDEAPLGSLGSIAAGSPGQVWTANRSGIVHQSANGWRLHDHADFGREPADYPAASSQEFWVATGSDGDIWGGIGCHAYRFAAGEWEALPPLPDVTELCWRAVVTPGPDGSLWMSPGCCFTETPVYHLDQGTWEVLEPPVTENTGMAVSPDGSVWLTSFSGIAQFDGTEWTRVMSGTEFAAIAAGGDGRVWAAGSRWATRTGLWVHDAGNWSLTRPGVTIEALATGPDGTVWALETQLDGRVDLLNTSTGRVRFITDAGLIHTLAISDDGTIWAGGEGRLYRIDPFD